MSIFDRLVGFHEKKMHSDRGRRLRMTSAVAAAALNIGVSYAKEAPTSDEVQTPVETYINVEAENRVAQMTTLKPRAEIFYNIHEVSNIENAQAYIYNNELAYYDDGANAIVINQILIKDKDKEAKEFEQTTNIKNRSDGIKEHEDGHRILSSFRNELYPMTINDQLRFHLFEEVLQMKNENQDMSMSETIKKFKSNRQFAYIRHYENEITSTMLLAATAQEYYPETVGRQFSYQYVDGFDVELAGKQYKIQNYLNSSDQVSFNCMFDAQTGQRVTDSNILALSKIPMNTLLDKDGNAIKDESGEVIKINQDVKIDSDCMVSLKNKGIFDEIRYDVSQAKENFNQLTQIYAQVNGISGDDYNLLMRYVNDIIGQEPIEQAYGYDTRTYEKIREIKQMYPNLNYQEEYEKLDKNINQMNENAKRHFDTEVRPTLYTQAEFEQMLDKKGCIDADKKTEIDAGRTSQSEIDSQTTSIILASQLSKIR